MPRFNGPSKRKDRKGPKTREDALKCSHKIYGPSDIPCEHGHRSMRRTQSNRCLTCETLGKV